MSEALLQLAADLRRKGCLDMALSLPDALWLARLLPTAETPTEKETRPDRGTEVEGSAAPSATTSVPAAGVPQPFYQPVPATPPPIRIKSFDVDVPELRPDRLPVGMLVPRQLPGAQAAGRGPDIRIPAPPSLSDPQEFGRRLKPRRHFRRNPRKPLVDVTRTVERICDEEIWDLVVKYPYDRCLHLTWIIDAGGSMELWRQTARELFVACRDSGAFRSCQAYEWDVDQQWQQSFTPLDSSAMTAPGPVGGEWPVTGRDRLIVIFSDCSAGRWYHPAVLRQLQVLTEQAQLLVINPLPERMWGRTALGQAVEVDLRSPTPGAPGRRLQTCSEDLDSPLEDHLGLLRLLAVTADPDQLLGWSRFVAGRRAVYPGFCMHLDRGFPAAAIEASDVDADQRLERFRRYASRGGRELARLMSAVPLLTPRFIRLVRQKMMPDEFAPSHLHEAELLLSPLLRVVDDGEGCRERIYDFYPGVRQRLLEQTPTALVREIFLHFVALEVRGDLPRRFSLGEYGAMIPRPDDPDADCTVHPLSDAPTELILRRLGGKFRRFLDDARSSSLRLELNSHLRRADEARASVDLNTALAALDDALALVEEDPDRWGQACVLLREQLALYRGLLHLPNLVRRVASATESFVEPTTGMVLAPVSSGSFLMGSPDSEPERYSDEGPRHRVTLSHDFWMGTYPVTQQQYEAVTGDNPSHFKGADRPVENVSWEDAVSYCRQLTERARSSGVLPEGCAFRLPTEAEWEYCCRAGTETATAFGDSLSSEQANFDGNYPYGGASKGPYLARTSDVGSYAPNAWGLYDMHGNVWEWCLDAAELDDNVKTDTYVDGAVDPLCSMGGYRVVRGGRWGDRGGDCRSAFRHARGPGRRLDYLGFRVCLARSPAKSEP